MTYKIIGGDGREYGPVSDADLRKWIAEGRLNAQSQAKDETDADFRPLSTFAEFADLFGAAAPASSFPSTSYPLHATDWSKHDYELDIGGSIARGWTLFMDNIGILLGCTVLYLLVVFAGSFVINAVLGGVLSQIVPETVVYSAPYMILQGIVLQAIMALFAGPMAGGYYYLFIRKLRGETVGVGDLFAGFQRAYTRLFLGYLIFTLIALVCFIPFDFVWAARAGSVLIHLRHSPNPSEMQGLFRDLIASFTSTGPIMLLCLIPTVYFTTSLRFTLPLIIDQDMDVWTAIGTSWKMVHKHWWTVFGLVFLSGLIYMAGAFLCCIGLIFTVGIATAAMMFAYETIFCEKRT